MDRAAQITQNAIVVILVRVKRTTSRLRTNGHTALLVQILGALLGDLGQLVQLESAPILTSGRSRLRMRCNLVSSLSKINRLESTPTLIVEDLLFDARL